MKQFYLWVSVLMFSTSLAAQINIRPLEYNATLQNAKAEADQEFQNWAQSLTGNAIDSRLQERTDCPIVNDDMNYVFPGDTISFFLDTFNNQTYRILNTTDRFGVGFIDGENLLFAADAASIAGIDSIIIERTVDTTMNQIVYPITTRRRNQSTILPDGQLTASERTVYCVDDLSDIPGEILCNRLFRCSESYGGNGLQRMHKQSSNKDEACFIYNATRFPGRDTICMVYCDEFTICDTFYQPILIVGDTLGLPFFDDFSGGGIYPSSELWLDDLTFINQTMGYEPPSIGVATFDGLDSGGTPYGEGFGVADRLTSKEINLSQLVPGNQVYLSFYYQPKGRGYFPPERAALLVEFKKNDGTWETVAELATDRDNVGFEVFPPFTPIAIKLEDLDYFHNAFQFRFKNLHDRDGMHSLWHVDYVELKTNGSEDLSNDDLSLSEPPTNLLNRYTSAPLRQLKAATGNVFDGEFTAKVFNHKPSLAFNPTDSRIIFQQNGNLTSSNTLFDATNVEPREFVSASKSLGGNLPSELEGLISNLSSTVEETEIVTIYDINSSDDFKNNDTTKTSIICSNYFAYDDGTAELAIELNGLGNIIAVEYELNVQDTLQAIQMHFPHLRSDFRDLLFNVVVYFGDLKAEPDFRQIGLRPVYLDEVEDSLQGFTTYLLGDNFSGDPIVIPAGKFYIGWQVASSSTNPIAVGFDRNNPEASQYLWSSNGAGTWFPYPTGFVRGAPMLRPIMGGTPPEQTSTNDIENESNFAHLYPNPAGEFLNFEIENSIHENFQIQIINNLGQTVHRGILDSRLEIGHLPKGIYYAKVIKTSDGIAQTIPFVKN